MGKMNGQAIELERRRQLLLEKRFEPMPERPKPKRIEYKWHQRWYLKLMYFIAWATLGRVIYWLLKTPTRWTVKRAYMFGVTLFSRRLPQDEIEVRREICYRCSQCVDDGGHKYCDACPCFKWRPARLGGWKTTKRGMNCPIGKHPGSVELGCVK